MYLILLILLARYQNHPFDRKKKAPIHPMKGAVFYFCYIKKISYMTNLAAKVNSPVVNHKNYFYSLGREIVTLNKSPSTSIESFPP